MTVAWFDSMECPWSPEMTKSQKRVRESDLTLGHSPEPSFKYVALACSSELLMTFRASGNARHASLHQSQPSAVELQLPLLATELIWESLWCIFLLLIAIRAPSASHVFFCSSVDAKAVNQICNQKVSKN